MGERRVHLLRGLAHKIRVTPQHGDNVVYKFFRASDERHAER
jgi:hypothetical protein